MRNINIITLVIILFCSCTSSGKLTDAKFPYHPYYGKNLTAEQINATGTILNAGSYVITPRIIDWAKIEIEQRRFNIITISIMLGIVIIPMLIAFGTKDKISDNDGTFPAIHTSRDIKNIISNYEKSL